MFNNVGKKIKSLAKILLYILSVTAIIAGIVLLILFYGENRADVGIVCLVCSFLTVPIIWISLFALYGFGELIDNSAEILNVMKQSKKENKDNKSESSLDFPKRNVQTHNTPKQPISPSDKIKYKNQEY